MPEDEEGPNKKESFLPRKCKKWEKNEICPGEFYIEERCGKPRAPCTSMIHCPGKQETFTFTRTSAFSGGFYATVSFSYTLPTENVMRNVFLAVTYNLLLHYCSTLFVCMCVYGLTIMETPRT